MGFHLAKLKSKKLLDYIGSKTIYSCAEAGAFDSKTSKDLEDYMNLNEEIIGILDENGIKHCLNILKSGRCLGRDVNKLIKLLTEKYKDGIMIVQ